MFVQIIKKSINVRHVKYTKGQLSYFIRLMKRETSVHTEIDGLMLGLDVGLEVTGVEGEELGDFEGFREGDNVG